jgi:hypothetical protein
MDGAGLITGTGITTGISDTVIITDADIVPVTTGGTAAGKVAGKVVRWPYSRSGEKGGVSNPRSFFMSANRIVKIAAIHPLPESGSAGFPSHSCDFRKGGKQ